MFEIGDKVLVSKNRHSMNGLIGEITKITLNINHDIAYICSFKLENKITSRLFKESELNLFERKNNKDNKETKEMSSSTATTPSSLPQYAKGLYLGHQTGNTVRTTEVMRSEIKDVKIINEKVVIVTFRDDTTEKAVLQGEDTFDIEHAITVCICKKMLGGSKLFHKRIKESLKVIELAKKEEEKNTAEKEMIARKKEKAQKKRKEYLDRKAAKERQKQIDITSEAFLLAMRRYDDEMDVRGAEIMDAYNNISE